MLTNIIQPSITAGFGIYKLISDSTDVFRNEEVVIIFTNIELFSPIYLYSKNSGLIGYLVCVAEFTDLSGYQVSLVFLDLHGTDILLIQRKERGKRATAQ